ncbi:PREDICTED: uncharacterized protein LOC104610406 isoform X2 [Nelumbo nucifera]|uniref:Uncharacterized protein LOC104610406 isoform X2 n=1 Tax=Nelumbo nucifera TaxID=4432 RepID=A0A1U8BF02_NELNU|nr:PREDICTED: uncharacterized protein LOC104610406 isoform X2 [Nelumbo nucifera]
MAAGTACLITSINAEAAPSNGVPRNQNPLPRLSFSRPSWVVRTESNVRKEEKNKPYPPCVVCRGSGRVKCCHCQGRGRTNCIQLVMLPKGEWPKWCKTCGGSGLGYCSRCLGTGEHRGIMGFRFMKMDAQGTQQGKENPQ